MCDAARAREADDLPSAVCSGPWWTVPGAMVEHQAWGSGQVLSLSGDRLTVLFETAGYRNLSATVVADADLLSPVGSCECASDGEPASP